MLLPDFAKLKMIIADSGNGRLHVFSGVLRFRVLALANRFVAVPIPDPPFLAF